MGSVSFNSPSVVLEANPAKVFAFLSDLDNLEHLMPEQVIKWKSDKKSCSFEIKGMANISLLLGKLVENRLVTVDSGPDNPIETQILFQLNEKSADRTGCIVTLNAELSMMLQMLASTPLQNLVNIMSDKLMIYFMGRAG